MPQINAPWFSSGRTSRQRAVFVLAAAAGAIALASPAALGSLTGSGQLTDIVSLTTTTNTIAGSAMSTSAGAPVVASSYFNVNNGNSNVDTLIRYDYSTAPYYGTTSSQTSITLHGTTYQIIDLIMLKQAIVNGAGTTTTSSYFSPLSLKSGTTSSYVTFTTTGNACTGWTGTPAVGFLAASAGTLVFDYYDATTQTDNTPTASETYDWCLDTTSNQVYVAKATTAYGSATLIQIYTTNSVLASLKTYQYEFLPGSYTTGNKYCLVAVAGSGTSAKPDLVQCSFLGYSTSGSAKAYLTPMFDPPTYFPSNNQAGSSSVVTFVESGTQWDPYAYTTTNTAT